MVAVYGSTTDLLKKVAILHEHCYMGRNIRRFFSVTKDNIDLMMLYCGYFNIAPLIGYNEALCVKVVRDIEKLKNRTYKYHDVEVKTDFLWIPGNRAVNKMCGEKTKAEMETIYPVFEVSS